MRNEMGANKRKRIWWIRRRDEEKEKGKEKQKGEEKRNEQEREKKKGFHFSIRFTEIGP